MSAGLSALSADDVREVVGLAVRAPSVHNSQPWSFGWDGRTLSVREDPARGLPVLDPDGRDRLLSCGAALHHLRVLLAARGFLVRTALLPDPGDPLLLARLAVQAGRAPSAAERALAAAVPERATARDRFGPEQVPDEVLEQLHVAAAAEGVWLRVLGREGHDDVAALQLLTARAEQAQRTDPVYLRELQAWRHDGDDGIPDVALPDEPVSGRGSSWALRDFSVEETVTSRAQDPPPAEHPTVVVLGTADDDRRAWLLAGQALSRVLLTVTARGLGAQPITALFEVPGLRERARHVLGVLGHPQVLVRIGTATAAPVSRRRPVEDVLHLTAPTLDDVVVEWADGSRLPAVLLDREPAHLLVVRSAALPGGVTESRRRVRVLSSDRPPLTGLLRCADEEEAAAAALTDLVPRPSRDVVLVLEHPAETWAGTR